MIKMYTNIEKMLASGYNYSIIYTERNNNTEIEAKIKEMIKLPRTEDPKLPMLIKIKEGKVIEKIERVTLDNVVDNLKKLSR